MLTTLVAGLVLAQSQGATVPGVTVWVWKLEGDLQSLPQVTEGQTPNAYFVNPTAELVDSVDSQEGAISDHFAGEMHGWIDAPADGTYDMQIEADDGGRLFIGGKLVVDIETEADPSNRFVARAPAVMKKGLNAFKFSFYENTGKFYARMKWKKPGDSGFTLVPTGNLKSEAGQTFVVSPGVKTSSPAGSPFAPGDRAPLKGVHPAYTLENFRGPNFQPAVGGLCFIPDGRLAVCTWDPDGAVYLLDVNKSPVTMTKFAEGLGEPLGIAWFDNALLVTQKGEVTRLVDADKDGVADRYEVVSSGWPQSHNYHEFTFNLVPRGGKLNIMTSVPLRGGWTNYTPGSTGAFPISNGPGRWYEIDPKTGEWKVMGKGLRTPNGLNVCVDGQLFGCDNQGSWMPSSRMNVYRVGGFYGHQETPDGRVEMDPPVAWFPQNEIGNSPSEPVLVPDGEYRGQVFVGDVTHGGIKRVFVEKVDGVYQGTVFRFSQGLEAGVNRLVWGPDGCLYVGGIGSNGNWNHENTKFGLQRLRYNGQIPFEMKRVESRKGGLQVTFSRPVGDLKDASVDVQQFRYEQSENYGGPKLDLEKLTPKLTWSDDKTTVFLSLAGLKPEHVVYLRWKGLKSASGEAMWSTESWSTINRLSAKAADIDVHADLPLDMTPPVRSNVIINEDAFDMVLVGEGPNRWERKGNTIWVDVKSGDMKTREKFGDMYLHAEWFSPPGGDLAGQLNGNGGIKIQGRYELQVLNTPGLSFGELGAAPNNEAGSIYLLKSPSRNVSFGPGVWQTYDVWFTAPRWQGEKKVANARMTVYWNGFLVHRDVEIPDKTGASAAEAPGEWETVFQAHASSADGRVGYRNVWIVRNPIQNGLLPPFMNLQVGNR